MIDKFLNKLFLIVRYTDDVQTCKLNPNVDQQEWEIPQFFNRTHNTRKKIPSETIAEIDILPFREAYFVIVEFCKRLAEKRFHFFIWYAEGQRSPHIRIYDIQDFIGLRPDKREILQANFWKSIYPEGFQYLDKSVWSDEHPLQLEFTKHWKYGTKFNLILEYATS